MREAHRAQRGLNLLAAGVPAARVAKMIGVSERTVYNWRTRGVPTRRTGQPRPCPRCDGVPLDHVAYALVLGYYLGDGTVSSIGRGRFILRVFCDSGWPGVMDEVDASIRQVRPGGAVSRVVSGGCTTVQSAWIHWPCLLPQHGPGRKHLRPIVLANWQVSIVERHPRPFLRGLFHSDGCRVVNRVSRQLAGGVRRYEYPRYLFSNESDDILRLCEWACDLVGVEHRRTRPNCLSVARRDSVALLDTFVGPKS